MSFVALCVMLFVVSVTVGVAAAYPPPVYYGIVLIELSAIVVAVWNVGAWAIRSDVYENQQIATAGALLLVPWVLFSLLPGVGRPDQATAAQNQLRYLILVIDSIAIGVGLFSLREVLRESGERFYSTLGVAAIAFATPLYVIFSIIELTFARTEIHTAEQSLRLLSLADDVMLFFAGALTYLAAAAFAAALRRKELITRGASRAFIAASLIALLLLAIRGLQFTQPARAFVHWYTIPGWVVGIPAVPWILLMIFGVVLLRRAGRTNAIFP